MRPYLIRSDGPRRRRMGFLSSRRSRIPSPTPARSWRESPFEESPLAGPVRARSLQEAPRRGDEMTSARSRHPPDRRGRRPPPRSAPPRPLPADRAACAARDTSAVVRPSAAGRTARHEPASPAASRRPPADREARRRHLAARRAAARRAGRVRLVILLAMLGSIIGVTVSAAGGEGPATVGHGKHPDGARWGGKRDVPTSSRLPAAVEAGLLPWRLTPRSSRPVVLAGAGGRSARRRGRPRGPRCIRRRRLLGEALEWHRHHSGSADRTAARRGPGR